MRDATPRFFAAVVFYGISTHASLAGRDKRDRGLRLLKAISTHASLAGRDRAAPVPARRRGISTHASLAGRDSATPALWMQYHDFNPRVPCGTRPGVIAVRGRACEFQPTRPLRDATACPAAAAAGAPDFNPRVPCGTRLALAELPVLYRLFQPTRPLRDATCDGDHLRIKWANISTHASLAGRDLIYEAFRQEPLISTHASLAGRDFDG